ncbi:hypothetical protein GobsT_18580 [Gemmata obscuriglobus]|uniref:Uncharacterized protein n=1 Tax=Gemmata obscuriglobus TaxID=114 RepID=A0A2Z3HEQ4_9BACT|nr:hypothetical protein [Gemmata obscuriglobus]AWM39780.1 hypothetical protein C1280_24095 [Gemmata obscuriglobus]QEG27105.1 hypothetical protein GobsT_18580 [Gemmata obscuriglobus]VTS03610.1 unnamed protein product [Gemmata obscuriglobus UQM 2246]
MKEIEIGGKQYRLTPITAQDYALVAEEYRASRPDPVKQLLETANDLPEGLRDDFVKKHLDQAFEEKKRAGAINDAAFQGYLSTVEGGTKLFVRTLRKYQPGLTAKEAGDIFWEGVAEHGDGFLDGLVPKGVAGAHVRGRRGKGVLPG